MKADQEAITSRLAGASRLMGVIIAGVIAEDVPVPAYLAAAQELRHLAAALEHYVNGDLVIRIADDEVVT
jgi:hypothetical protein